MRHLPGFIDPRVLALALACAAAPACGSSERVGSGAASADESAAQREYRNLRARWFAASAVQRAALEQDIRRFAARHPGDAHTQTTQIFLAWIAIDRHQLADARAALARARGGRGSDYGAVTAAAIATRAEDPERALAVLEPLVGKIVDADERLVHAEELVRATLAARRYELSIHAMLDWVVQAPPDRQDSARLAIVALLEGMPSDDAVASLGLIGGALERDTGSAEFSAARRWLAKALFSAIAKRALDAGDASLARSLLPQAPPASRATAEYAALARQAAQGGAAPRIAGRAVGLFLSVGSDEARRRSAALAMGLSRGLEAASPHVELVVRDDAGVSERSAAALSALAGDGAAILVAGADDESAARATAFAERAHIPLLLVRSAPVEQERRYSFVLAPSDDEIVGLLEQSLRARGLTSTARVGAGGVACSTPQAVAGKPRFPVDEWQKQQVQALIVVGATSCARSLAREVGISRHPPLVACGLECSESVLAAGGANLGVKAGSFPAGRSDWYEALGRDAAALASAALADFPEQRVVDQTAVGELHTRARDALERAEVKLETSEQRGFGGAHILPRTLGLVDGASEPRLKSSESP